MASPHDWEAARDDSANISLKGHLSFSPTNVCPRFRLQLKLLQDERACRFQRAFGGDRFLTSQFRHSKLQSCLRVWGVGWSIFKQAPAPRNHASGGLFSYMPRSRWNQSPHKGLCCLGAQAKSIDLVAIVTFGPL